MEKLTIIIPNYNNEQYIDKCFKSLCEQSYNNFKVIFIDDCSNDKSLTIAKKYSKKLNLQILSNEHNSGAGFSRNYALSFVDTEYVSFLDSDDYLSNNYYEILMKCMTNNDLDLVLCDITLDYGDKKLLCSTCEGIKGKDNYINNGFAASPCNKIFKTSLIKKYPFAEGIMNEDIPAVISCLIAANKIEYVSEVSYNYVQHEKSIQNSVLSDKRLAIFNAVEVLFDRVDCNKYKDAILYNQIILFLLYIVPKENSFFRRWLFLRKYNKKFATLVENDNEKFNEFLNSQSKLHKLYYKTLFKLSKMKLSFLESLIYGMYHFYKSNFTKNVLKKDYSIDDLVKLSKKRKQQLDISVVIPNYNYERFMIQRLYSILNQNYSYKEIIILDDCSRDNSVELINSIINALNSQINIKLVVNETNSGSAFKQWRKGIELASGRYVWIAEADDYCDKKYLKRIFKLLTTDNDISFAYCDTAFIDADGKMIKRSVKRDIDLLETGHWNNSYVNDGMNEIINYSYLNCTVANVSSVIFRNSDFSNVFEKMGTFKQVGDWLFYINLMEKGKVAYYHKALNYYRVHGSNATTLNKKQLHYNEIKRLHHVLNDKYHFSKIQLKNIQDRYDFLESVWGIEK